jgi:hypothetical protein
MGGRGQRDVTGNLTLTWAPRDGDRIVAVMNSDASPSLTVRADAGISSPALPWLAGPGDVELAVTGLRLVPVLASVPCG